MARKKKTNEDLVLKPVKSKTESLDEILQKEEEESEVVEGKEIPLHTADDEEIFPNSVDINTEEDVPPELEPILDGDNEFDDDEDVEVEDFMKDFEAKPFKYRYPSAEEVLEAELIDVWFIYHSVKNQVSLFAVTDSIDMVLQFARERNMNVFFIHRLRYAKSEYQKFIDTDESKNITLVELEFKFCKGTVLKDFAVTKREKFSDKFVDLNKRYVKHFKKGL